MVTPGRAYKQKKKKLNEIEAAKNFILSSAVPGTG